MERVQRFIYSPSSRLTLERDFLGPEFFDQIGELLERHVAIVVAMNKEHGERQFAMLPGSILSNVSRLCCSPVG